MAKEKVTKPTQKKTAAEIAERNAQIQREIQRADELKKSQGGKNGNELQQAQESLGQKEREIQELQDESASWEAMDVDDPDNEPATLQETGRKTQDPRLNARQDDDEPELLDDFTQDVVTGEYCETIAVRMKRSRVPDTENETEHFEWRPWQYVNAYGARSAPRLELEQIPHLPEGKTLSSMPNISDRESKVNRLLSSQSRPMQSSLKSVRRIVWDHKRVSSAATDALETIDPKHVKLSDQYQTLQDRREHKSEIGRYPVMFLECAWRNGNFSWESGSDFRSMYIKDVIKAELQIFGYAEKQVQRYLDHQGLSMPDRESAPPGGTIATRPIRNQNSNDGVVPDPGPATSQPSLQGPTTSQPNARGPTTPQPTTPGPAPSHPTAQGPTRDGVNAKVAPTVPASLPTPPSSKEPTPAVEGPEAATVPHQTKLLSEEEARDLFKKSYLDGLNRRAVRGDTTKALALWENLPASEKLEWRET